MVGFRAVVQITKQRWQAELHQNEGHSVSQVALKLLREKRLQTACLARA